MAKKDDLSTWSPIKSQRCHAHKKDGTQCKKQAILGLTVCRFHGGATKNAKEKARQNMLEMLLPAVAELRKILLKADTADGDRLRAIKEVADRTGLTGVLNVQVDLMAQWMEDTAGADVLVTYDGEDAAKDAELQRLRAEVEALKAAANAVHPQPALGSRSDEVLEPTAIFEPDDPWVPGPTDDQEEQRARLGRYQRGLQDRLDS
jgi:hypothetical protein